MKTVLFKSSNRFDSFLSKMKEFDLEVTVLDLADNDWYKFDFSQVEIVIYFPTFKFSSNHPLALSEVYDNLQFIKKAHPQITMFPDPAIINYYNDKYRQFLFLQKNGFPIPDTIPLFSENSVKNAISEFGFPVVVKNRYGAGGDSVFMANTEDEVMNFYRLSKLDFYHAGGLKMLFKNLTSRGFYYHLIKEKNLKYPFFSYPLIAQRFIKMDRDLKTVTGDYKVVEAHWRVQTDESMWKVNIDGGGIGEWSYVAPEALEVSVKLAKALKTQWINIDLSLSEGEFLISEFSPVWHHYKYKEKPNFIYKDNYNIEMPLEKSLDLEQIIVESLINAAQR